MPQIHSDRGRNLRSLGTSRRCSSAEFCKVDDFCLRRKPPRTRRRLAPSTMNFKKTGFWRFDEAEGPRCILSPAFGIETCGSRASSATLALPRRLEAAPDGKWAYGEQLDKFRGLFSVFASCSP